MEHDQFKAVFRRLASGVSVVTFRVGDVVHGITATSLTPVSLEPPMALFCIGRHSRNREHLRVGAVVGMSLLGTAQKALSERFGTSQPLGSFGDVDMVFGRDGAPTLSDAIATLDAKIIDVYPGGDHVICLCRLVAMRTGTDDDPLIHFARRYHQLGQEVDETSMCQPE